MHEIFVSRGFPPNVPPGRKLVFLTCKWGGSSPSALRKAQIASCAAVCSVLPSSSSSGLSRTGWPALRRDSPGLHSEDASRTLCHFWGATQTSNGTLHWECLVHVVPSSDRRDCGDEAFPANTDTVTEDRSSVLCALNELIVFIQHWILFTSIVITLHLPYRAIKKGWLMWIHTEKQVTVLQRCRFSYCLKALGK